jgi:hypothetical protein
MPRYDLTVRRAQNEWKQIRWALFVFPDIRDVEPTDDPEVIRIFYEGKRAYPDVWRTELVQAGFDVPPVGSPPSYPVEINGSELGICRARR